MTWVAAVAATGGGIADKEGGLLRWQFVLGESLVKGQVGNAGAVTAEIFQVVFGYRGSVVVSYMTVSEP